MGESVIIEELLKFPAKAAGGRKKPAEIIFIRSEGICFLEADESTGISGFAK